MNKQISIIILCIIACVPQIYNFINNDTHRATLNNINQYKFLSDVRKKQIENLKCSIDQQERYEQIKKATKSKEKDRPFIEQNLTHLYYMLTNIKKIRGLLLMEKGTELYYRPYSITPQEIDQLIEICNALLTHLESSFTQEREKLDHIDDQLEQHKEEPFVLAKNTFSPDKKSKKIFAALTQTIIEKTTIEENSHNLNISDEIEDNVETNTIVIPTKKSSKKRKNKKEKKAFHETQVIQKIKSTNQPMQNISNIKAETETDKAVIPEKSMISPEQTGPENSNKQYSEPIQKDDFYGLSSELKDLILQFHKKFNHYKNQVEIQESIYKKELDTNKIKGFAIVFSKNNIASLTGLLSDNNKIMHMLLEENHTQGDLYAKKNFISSIEQNQKLNLDLNYLLLAHKIENNSALPEHIYLQYVTLAHIFKKYTICYQDKTNFLTSNSMSSHYNKNVETYAVVQQKYIDHIAEVLLQTNIFEWLLYIEKNTCQDVTLQAYLSDIMNIVENFKINLTLMHRMENEKLSLNSFETKVMQINSMKSIINLVPARSYIKNFIAKKIESLNPDHILTCITYDEASTINNIYREIICSFFQAIQTIYKDKLYMVEELVAYKLAKHETGKNELKIRLDEDNTFETICEILPASIQDNIKELIPAQNDFHKSYQKIYKFIFLNPMEEGKTLDLIKIKTFIELSDKKLRNTQHKLETTLHGVLAEQNRQKDNQQAHIKIKDIVSRLHMCETGLKFCFFANNQLEKIIDYRKNMLEFLTANQQSNISLKAKIEALCVFHEQCEATAKENILIYEQLLQKIKIARSKVNTHINIQEEFKDDFNFMKNLYRTWNTDIIQEIEKLVNIQSF